jgi:hypothetical protein
VIVDAGLWHHEDRTPTHGYEATREGAMSLISLNVRFRRQPGPFTEQHTAPRSQRKAEGLLDLLSGGPQGGPDPGQASATTWSKGSDTSDWTDILDKA